MCKGKFEHHINCGCSPFLVRTRCKVAEETGLASCFTPSGATYFVEGICQSCEEKLRAAAANVFEFRQKQDDLTQDWERLRIALGSQPTLGRVEVMKLSPDGSE